MRRTVRPGVGWLCCALLSAWACGADNLEAPPPKAPANVRSCKTFDQIMPRFVSALATGQTEGLRHVMENALVQPYQNRPDQPPPMADVLRSVFFTLTAFSLLPPEAGADSGQLCVHAPATLPPVSQANPMCEVRRALDTFVHQGTSLTALKLADPLVAGLLDYLVGRPPSSSTPHYEVAGVLSGMCQNNAVCQMNDTLDLVIALTQFLQTPTGAKTLDDVNRLLNNPALVPYLSNNGQQYGGEEGVVALAKVLLQVLQGMTDPSGLDQLPLSVFPASLQPDVKTVIQDLKVALDPKANPSVLAPLKRVVNCYAQVDVNSDVIRMSYRLTFVAKLPAFQVNALIGAVKALKDNDARGTLIYLVGTFAKALRKDSQAVDSAARVCHQLFSATVDTGQTQSNAEQALPSVANLFEQGVAAEAICAIDTLVYGCAGGSQPACGP